MSNDSKLKETAAEIANAQRKGLLESTKDSIRGWREMAGTTAGFAIFLDLMFIVLGYVGWTQPGLLHWLGAIAIVIGAFGLVEKIGRRAV